MEPVNYTCFFIDEMCGTEGSWYLLPTSVVALITVFTGEWAEQKGRRSSYGVAHLSSAGDWRMGRVNSLGAEKRRIFEHSFFKVIGKVGMF